MQNSENNEVPVTPNPNPGAPVVPPVAPESTPPTNPITPAAGPTPMSAQSANSMKSNDSLGTAAVLTALVPPIGLILGIMSIIKGSKSGNKKLSLFGGVAILLSVIIGLLYAFVVIPRIPALAGSKYSKTKNITVNKGSLNVTIPIAAAYEEDTSPKNSTDQEAGKYGIENKYFYIYSDQKTKKNVVAGLLIQYADFSVFKKLGESTGEEFNSSEVVNQFTKDLVEEDDNEIIQDLIQEEGSVAASLNNVKIISKEKSGNNGAVIKFTAESKSSDGKKVEIIGELTGYMSSDLVLVSTVQIVEKNAYNSNKKTFDNVNLSIKNQIK